MIKVFGADEKKFKNNGIAVIKPALLEECIITQEQNGEYKLEMKTIDLKYKDVLIHDNIIYIDNLKCVKTGKEAFRIEEPRIEDGMIEIEARQLFYSLDGSAIKEIEEEERTLERVLEEIQEKAVPGIVDYTIYTNIESEKIKFKTEPGSAGSTIIEAVNKYGGKLYRNLFDIEVLDRIGKDTEEVLRFGNGIKVYSKNVIWEDVATSVLPYCEMNENTVYLQENNGVVNGKIQYKRPYCKVLKVDLEEGTETEQQAREQMKRAAEEYIEKNNVPSFTYEVGISEEKDMNVCIGDSIRVYIKEIAENNLYAEITKYEYDVLKNAYKSITLGNYGALDVKTVIANPFNNLKEQIKNKIEEDSKRKNQTFQEIKEDVNTIQKILGGKAVKYTEEGVIIGNGSTIEDSEKIMVLNKSGIGCATKEKGSELTGEEEVINIIDMQGNVSTKDKEVIQQSITKEDGCDTMYSGTRIRTYGKMSVVFIDMSIKNSLSKNGTVEIASFDVNIAPGKDIAENTVTYNGKACYVIVKATGKINITAIEDIQAGDGVREELVFFIKE